MRKTREYGALDVVRLVAAFLVITVHISPLVQWSEAADFFLTRVLARLAVPFFLMTTGFFVLPGDRDGQSSVRREVRKLAWMYLLAMAIYLPIGIYAGHYQGLSIPDVVRLVVFDGTFYHLWYFPAAILGLLLLDVLGKHGPRWICLAVCVALYLLGLLGDSYWGLTERIPLLSDGYRLLFRFSSYTRNGIFFAPLFLYLGQWQARRETSGTQRGNALCFAAAFAAMTAEAFVLRGMALQRHDSMYLLLPVCALALFRLALGWHMPAKPLLRRASAWVYLLHPAVLVAVRGGARLLHLTGILVDNRIVLTLAVASATAVLAFAVAELLRRNRRPDARSRSWIELDGQALERNVQTLKALLPQGCELMPAVKAQAYGHGAVPVCRALNRMGIRNFCVACVTEGVELRRNGIVGQILILGYTAPEDFPLLRRYRLTQTVLDLDYARQLEAFGKKIAVHVALDTGMHRLGERYENFEAICEIFRMRRLQVTGVYTHLCADDTDRPDDRAFTMRQAQAFFDTVEELKRHGCCCPKAHLLASYGVLNYPELGGDYARVGIALYGLRSSEDDFDRTRPQLTPVLSWKARVASVRELAPGERAGYGLTFTAETPARLATLAVGYADGFPRSLSCGVGEVLIRGKRAPVVGRVCMDQMTVDVTGIDGVVAGDTAVLIGSSGEETITAYDLARQSGTITNEILSRLGPRLSRLMSE